MPDQVSVTTFREKEYFQGEYSFFTLSAKNHHRKDLPASSVFTLCGNGLDREQVNVDVYLEWQEKLVGAPLLSSLLQHVHPWAGLHGHAQEKVCR